MDEQDRRRLRERDLAFCGRMAAGVSHEMRNVLSIIGEHAGLLDDLLAAAERGKSLDPEKLRRVSAKIVRQVKRGTEAMERFSRFAHAADAPTAETDLAALIGNVCDLAQRRAARAGCVVEFERPEESLIATTDPFRLQHAVFSALEVMLEESESGQTVCCRIGGEAAAAVLSITGGAAAGDRFAPETSEISTLVEEFGGTVAARVENGKRVLALTLPMR